MKSSILFATLLIALAIVGCSPTMESESELQLQYDFDQLLGWANDTMLAKPDTTGYGYPVFDWPYSKYERYHFGNWVIKLFHPYTIDEDSAGVVLNLFWKNDHYWVIRVLPWGEGIQIPTDNLHWNELGGDYLSSRIAQKLGYECQIPPLPPRLEWSMFYLKYFGLSVDLSYVQIPYNPGGFDRIVMIPKGLTVNDVYKVYWNNGLEVDFRFDSVIKNLRETNHSYAVRLRGRQQADEELRNLSYNLLKDNGTNSITLLEQMILGFKYWTESGQYLDITDIMATQTLCAGTHDADGYVPFMYYHAYNRRYYISACKPDWTNNEVRSRQVVSN